MAAWQPTPGQAHPCLRGVVCALRAGRTLAVDWSHRSRAHNEAAAEAGDEEAAAALEMARRPELSWMSGEKAEAIERVSRTTTAGGWPAFSVANRSSTPGRDSFVGIRASLSLVSHDNLCG